MWNDDGGSDGNIGAIFMIGKNDFSENDCRRFFWLKGVGKELEKEIICHMWWIFEINLKYRFPFEMSSLIHRVSNMCEIGDKIKIEISSFQKIKGDQTKMKGKYDYQIVIVSKN